MPHTYPSTTALDIHQQEAGRYPDFPSIWVSMMKGRDTVKTPTCLPTFCLAEGFASLSSLWSHPRTFFQRQGTRVTGQSYSRAVSGLERVESHQIWNLDMQMGSVFCVPFRFRVRFQRIQWFQQFHRRFHHFKIGLGHAEELFSKVLYVQSITRGTTSSRFCFPE